MLRTANPNLDEGRLFARYLDRAAEGFFRFWLGRRAADIIATAFVQPDHDLSYQHVTFAEQGKVIVGMVSGYTAEQHSRSSGRPLLRAAGKCKLRMMTISILCAPLLRILDTVDDDYFYLQAIAVDQERCGHGIGSALLDFIEDRAIASGANRLALDVSAKNEGARRIYERRGMAVASQWPKRMTIPGLRLLRMTKVL